MNQDEDSGQVRELYANLFRIGFNAAEFLLDAGRHFEDTDDRYYHRIITGPLHARELSRLLDESLRNYEETFGPIVDNTGDHPAE
jgi:hypothetical protein